MYISTADTEHVNSSQTVAARAHFLMRRFLQAFFFTMHRSSDSPQELGAHYQQASDTSSTDSLRVLAPAHLQRSASPELRKGPPSITCGRARGFEAAAMDSSYTRKKGIRKCNC